jgi:hypothetical protein
MTKIIIILSLLLCPVWAGAGDRISYLDDPCIEPELRRAWQNRYEFLPNDPRTYIKITNPRPPKKGHWEIMVSYLTEGFDKSGVSYYGVPASYKLKLLNKLLSKGWELQEPYMGQDIIYLKRWVED